MTLRIVITPGEPAGIGPELAVQLAQQDQPVELVAVADPDLLEERARLLNLPLALQTVDLLAPPQPQRAGTLNVLPVWLRVPCEPGRLDTANADYVLDTLRTATDHCLNATCHGMVTAPVHKGVINDAGHAFSGHTEFLADRCGVPRVVMMLAADTLRVALATTHLPLSEVPDAISDELLEQVIAILHRSLQRQFGLAEPRIAVLGLNPHAGEGGHLGSEEREIIEPCLARLREQGIRLSGPLPADTAFTPHHLEQCDAVLAMYHDQGLPVLKNRGFGRAVNVTLGLPIVRTSVDHGTALDLAGSGRADAGSLRAALAMAVEMAGHLHGNGA